MFLVYYIIFISLSCSGPGFMCCTCPLRLISIHYIPRVYCKLKTKSLIQHAHAHAGVLKINLAGANNLVPTTGLTPCIIIVHVYTCNYSGAEKHIDAGWHSLAS